MAVNKSKADLITQAATTLADNTTQAISPQDVREMAENLAESNFNKTTDNALVGLKAYDTGVIYKVSQGVNYNGSLYFANKDTTPGAFNTADWDLFAEQSNVVISGKKASAGTIAKGKPVYLVGFDSDLHTVEEANATAAGTTPVIGFTAEAFNASSSKSIITFGKLTGIDTSSFSVGNDLYLATSAGGLTTTRPTGGSSIIQRIAKVLKSHASTGEILIYNTARAAGLPNIAQDHVWIGDANGQPQAVNKSTLAPSDAAIETAYNNQVPAVTQSEAEAGTVTTVKRWTPQRIKQAIDALAGSGAATVYTANGTIGAGRVATLTNNFTIKNGVLKVEGADTLGTSSALQIYDGDSTPAVLWDFRNNGDIKVGQDINIITESSSHFYFKFCRPANGVNFSSIFSAELLNSSNVQNSYAQFGGAIVTNTAGNETGAGFINIEKNGTTTRALDIDTVNGLTINNNISSTNLLKVGDHLTVSKSTGDTTVTSTSLTPFTTYRNQGGANYYNEIQIDLNNSSNAQTTFGALTVVTESNTAGSETARLELKISDSGTLTTKLTVKNNSIVLAENLDMNNNRITNAVVNPSVQEVANSATFTINSDQQSDGVLTAMSAATTIAAPTGTPVQSQSLVFRFTDDGTARAITWNAIFRAIGVTLPTTTTANKLLYVGCKYNSTNTKWDVVSVQEEA